MMMARPAKETREVTGAKLQLLDLSKHYGPVVAVDRVSLVIEPGEFITLLGPSGSGKTTTMLMVAGFVEPTAGSILVDDVDVARMPPEQRNIGMVFQSYALFPHMTVAENIAFPLKMRRWKRERIDAAVADALEIVRLGGYGGRYPRELSGGQQQRVALARALVFRPPVLLMDEPLGALDKKLREELQIEIKHIQSDLGLTVVYVTHDQSEALTMSDRIAVMDHGQILQLDRPEVLYRQPATRFVADFLGDANVLRGSIVKLDEQGDLVHAPGGWQFRAPHTPEARVGETIECALRPEHLKLPAFPGRDDTILPATIVEQIYMGELTRLRVVLASGEMFTISQQNQYGSLNVEEGHAVEIGWRTADSVIVARQEPG